MLMISSLVKANAELSDRDRAKKETQIFEFMIVVLDIVF